MGTERNIFIIARKGSERDEDQLTELLAWLLDEVPAARNVVAALADAAADSNWSIETQRTILSGTESGRLDLLMVSARSTVVVEIKVDAPLGAGQLRKYTDWLRAAGTTDARHLLTLTEQDYLWPANDRAHAESCHVRPSAETWSTLRRRLLPLAESGELPATQRVLVGQFCAMLAVDIGRIDALRRAHFDPNDSTSTAIANDFYAFFGQARLRVVNMVGVKLHRNSEFWRRDVGFPMWYGYGESAPIFAVGFDSFGDEPGLIVGVRKSAENSSPTLPPPAGWAKHSLPGGSGYRWFGRSLTGLLNGDESPEQQQHEICAEWIRAVRDLVPPASLPAAPP